MVEVRVTVSQSRRGGTVPSVPQMVVHRPACVATSARVAWVWATKSERSARSSSG